MINNNNAQEKKWHYYQYQIMCNSVLIKMYFCIKFFKYVVGEKITSNVLNNDKEFLKLANKFRKYECEIILFLADRNKYRFLLIFSYVWLL